jgi:hypothetical protein
MILNHLSDAVSIKGIGNMDQIITEVTTVTFKAEKLSSNCARPSASKEEVTH